MEEWARRSGSPLGHIVHNLTLISQMRLSKTMDQTRLNELASALQRKGANKPCDRCGHSQFSIIDETLLTMQPLNGSFVVGGGGGVPAVVVACNNCGNLWHHALGALNMIPPELKKVAS